MLWGHLLPKVKVKSLAGPVVVEDDEGVKAKPERVKVEGIKAKNELVEKPASKRKLIKIEIEDSDDEAQEQMEFADLVKESGRTLTIEDIELRLSYLKPLGLP